MMEEEKKRSRGKGKVMREIMILVGSTDARVEEVKGHGLCHVFFLGGFFFVIKIERLKVP